MPSTIIGNPVASGPQILISGNVFSGKGAYFPQGGVQLVLDRSASGSVYVGLSGGTTLTSGGFYLSGTLGGLDGVQLAPGASYYIPRIAFPVSGLINVYVRHDAPCSGQARLYYEVF
jgi:hypothetical protein